MWKSIVLVSLVAVGCGTPPIVDLSAPVAHRMTPNAVEQVVLAKVAADERRVGRALVTPRIILVRLLAPGATYSAKSGAGFTVDAVSWVVEFEGTVVSCGSTCDAFKGGALVIDDATGDPTGGAYEGHVGKCVRVGEGCAVQP